RWSLSLAEHPASRVALPTVIPSRNCCLAAARSGEGGSSHERGLRAFWAQHSAGPLLSPPDVRPLPQSLGNSPRRSGNFDHRPPKSENVFIAFDKNAHGSPYVMPSEILLDENREPH